EQRAQIRRPDDAFDADSPGDPLRPALRSLGSFAVLQRLLDAMHEDHVPHRYRQRIVIETLQQGVERIDAPREERGGAAPSRQRGRSRTRIAVNRHAMKARIPGVEDVADPGELEEQRFRNRYLELERLAGGPRRQQQRDRERVPRIGNERLVLARKLEPDLVREIRALGEMRIADGPGNRATRQALHAPDEANAIGKTFDSYLGEPHRIGRREWIQCEKV